MSARTRSIIVVLVVVAFAVVSTVVLARGVSEPALVERASAPPPVMAPPPLAAEQRTCAAAADVLRELAAGRGRSGVAFHAVFPASGESAEQTAFGLARTQTSTTSPLSCQCYQPPECIAAVHWDVHHALQMTFTVDAETPRLTRVDATAGGW